MNGGDEVARVTLESAGEMTIKISELKVNEGKDLSQVDNISFGGDSNKGSITLDPNSIVLVGQSQVTVSPKEANKGTVYFTVGNDTKQYTNATVPNHTKVKFYAKPNTENVVFTGWEVADKVIYDNPTEVEVTGDLNFKARFPDGIHISCTVEPNDAAKPKVYQKDHPEWPLPDNGYVGPGQATTFAFKNNQEKYKFLGWYDAKNNNLLSTEPSYTVDNINVETKVIAKFSTSEINKECTITVDGKTRKYWLYVPASVEGQENVPVVFSLHGRGGNDTPDSEKPLFTSLAKENKFIVVYPQGRNAGSDQDKADYPGDDWKKGFGSTTGWEATGKENADTKFIKALVDKIQADYKTQSASNSNISVDPKKFYLCGFSMGGMMTYACAKVLNGTFAAYGSCSGYPLNEFHMNLATENPIPFIHLHSKDDAVVDIKLLHTIIENLLFRNGCKLSAKQNNDDGWTKTTENGMTRYDFKGVNGVPVTTVTFDTHGHSVQPSAPAYLWDFFSNNTVGQYDSKIEWKWDMPTINANISNSSSDSYYGWKHEINGTDRSLTYGGKDNNEGNHNVYNSIQLTPGKHTLYAKMTSTSGEESSVTLRNILTGAETVARKVVNNSGTTQATTYNVLYEFEVGEGAEFSLELKRSNTNSACTLLEIHKGSYRPEGVKDESQDNATVNLNDGKLAELTFENVADIWSIEKPVNELTSDGKNMKLYMKSRLGSVKDGSPL